MSDDVSELVNLVHQTRMYYEDRLAGEGFLNAYLFCDVEAIGAEKVRELRSTIEYGLGVPVEDIELSISDTSFGHDCERPELAIAPVGMLCQEGDVLTASGIEKRHR